MRGGRQINKSTVARGITGKVEFGTSYLGKELTFISNLKRLGKGLLRYDREDASGSYGLEQSEFNAIEAGREMRMNGTGLRGQLFFFSRSMRL